MATNMEKDASVTEQLEYVKGHDFGGVNTGNIDLLDSNGRVRRIPVPSTDPNDPLNLNKWRKLGIIITCCWFSIFSLVLVGGAGPILPFWIEIYAPQGYDTQSIVNLTTYPSLVMAFGAFLILPASMMFGRRPVTLFCCLLVVATTIGAARSTTFESHMACRILQGVATGATESVLPLIITDISFIDERGFWFACYWGTQNLVNALFTITVSYLAADLGWRWFYWVLAILAGSGTTLAFFCLPETRYQRSPQFLTGQVHYTDEFGVTQILSDVEARERLGDAMASGNRGELAPKRTYIQSLNPISSIAPDAAKLGLSALVKMAQSLSSPAVIWAIMATSITLGLGISMTLTYGTILTTDFQWPTAHVGLVNAGIFPASMAAMFYAGYLADKVNIWLARRRGGEHFPEDSLIMLIFPAIVSAIGTIVYAVTANSPASHSYWGIIMGWTLFEFGFIVVLITTTHFAAEAYPSNPGPALAVVVGLKNVVSFGTRIKAHESGRWLTLLQEHRSESCQW